MEPSTGVTFDQAEQAVSAVEEEKPKKKRRKKRKQNYDEADAEVAAILPREKPAPVSSVVLWFVLL